MFLRLLGEDAKTGAKTVGEQILAWTASVNGQNIKQGRTVASTSGSGQSASFFSAQSWTPQELLALGDKLLTVLEQALASDNSLVDDSSNTDGIISAMLASDGLQIVRQSGSDFTFLGMSSYYGGPA